MYLQLDTRFNPFTYDEMVKPLLYYKQAYDEAEKSYSDLAAQTEAWRNIANREQSPKAYGMFQRYSGDLENAVNDFSRGMTAKSRRSLLGLKRRYASDIQPIATAYARQSALADEQRKAELANPTMLWERKASDMSLDDFINNPSADYGRSTSGTALSAQVAAGAAALAKEFRNDPERMKRLVGGDYYEYVKNRGFSSESVLAAIMNNPDASPILTQLVESTIDASGIKGWNNSSALQQAYNYARQGLWNAVGQDEAQLVQNWRASENLQHSHAMAKQDAAYQRELEKAYLTQTAQPYLKTDGSVGYYEPITRTAGKNGGYTYGRSPLPTNAKKGNPRADSKGGSGVGSLLVDLTETNPDGTPRSQVGKFKQANNIDSQILTNSGTTVADLKKIPKLSLSKLKQAGFKVVSVIARNNDGSLQWGSPGEDYGRGNRYLDATKDGDTFRINTEGNKYRVKESNTGKWHDFGTNSNAVGDWGNFIEDKPDGDEPLRYVSDVAYGSLPAYDKKSIEMSVKSELNEQNNSYYSVFAIKGNDGKDSYVVAVSN